MISVIAALLADYAVIQPDGKLYVVGGGLADLAAGAALPLQLPQVAVVLRMGVDGDDVDRQHSFQLRLTDPAGHDLYSLTTRPQGVSPLSPIGDAHQGVVQLVLSLANVRFEMEGTYQFDISTTLGEPLMRLPLTVSVRPGAPSVAQFLSVSDPPLPVGTADPVLTGLQDAYARFQEGDVPQATAILRRLVDEHPASSLVRNNLGFVLTAGGDALEGLTHLREAERLAYVHEAILSTNIGVAEYLLGRHKEAMDRFKSALGLPLRAYPTVLLLVSADTARPITLESSGDCVAVLALNCAWSSLRMGAISDAQHFSAVASVGSSTLQRGSPGAATFAASFEQLATEISVASPSPPSPT